MSDDRLIVIAILFCVGDGDGCCRMLRSVVEWWAGLSGVRVWRRGGLFWRETLIKMAGRKMAGSLGSVVVIHGRHRLNEGRKAFLPLDSEMNKEILCNKHAL